MDQQVYVKNGYSALITVLIISAVSISVVMGLFMASIDKNQQVVIVQHSEHSKALSNACAEDALYQLKNNNSYTGTSSIILGDDSCEYKVISGTGDERSIFVTSTISGVTRNVQITTDSFNPLNILEWSELTQTASSTSNNVPGSFSLLSPVNGSETGITMLSFDWGDSIDPDGDDVYYTFTLNSFTTEVELVTGLNVSNYTLDFDLYNSSTYTWNVLAYDSYGGETLNIGGDWNFFTQDADGVPTAFGLTSPSNLSATTDTSPDFDWEDSNDPEGQDITYTFYLDNDSDFSSALVSETGLTQSRYILTITLDEGTTYYWKVLAIDDLGNSTWSNDVFSFTTPNSLIISYYFDSSPFSQAIDWSGNSNHGVLYGGVSNENGKLCNTALFDGSDDYISLAHNSSLINLSAFTMSMWISVPGFNDNARSIVYKENAYELNLEKSGQDYRVKGYVYLNGSQNSIRSSKIIRDADTWYHISLVYNGSNLMIYDGNSVDATQSAIGTVNTGIDSFYLGSPDYYKGYIDEFRFYNKALDSTEINSLINETRTCY